jgi:polysaccharide chain length determinant protein (PEP-CTERM system associated)
MNATVDHVINEIRGAWRFRWIGVAVACVLALTGWVVVFTLPDRYEAFARVFVDTRTALKPALQGLTVDQNVDAQINLVRQSLLAGPELEAIAKEAGVLPDAPLDARARDTIIDKLSSRLTLAVVSAGSQGDDRGVAGTIYNFDYTDVDRARALRVIDILLNTFVERTLGGKREGSENVQKFLETQIKDYEQRLSQAEDRLAAFKKKNAGLMPSEQGGFFAALQSEIDAQKKAETDLAVALSRREELNRQLHGDQVVSAAGTSGSQVNAQGVATGGDTLSRIEETQAKLDELLLKFTDQHPDVIATRAALDELKKRREKELESLKRGDASAVAASGAGNNPVYQSIQLELNKEDVQIAALRSELAQHTQSVAELRNQINSAPQVEAEYQQLNRDYDVNKAEYSALLENYQKARIGEKADNAGSMRFEVVQPPTSPAGPVWPKRGLFIAVVWLGAMGAGLGVAYLLHSLRPLITTEASVQELAGFPIIGVVGIAFPNKAGVDFKRNLVRFSAATAALFVFFVGVLVLNKLGVRLSWHGLHNVVKT